MAHLKKLDLAGMDITDRAQQHLEPLKNLRWTQVTDERVEKLQESLPNRKISR